MTAMEQDQHLRQDYPEQPRRRTLLNRLWALIGLLAFIELGWLGSSILKSRKTRNTQLQGTKWIEAGRAEALISGDVKAVPEGMLFLARLEDGGFIALSRTCTHLGCAISWDKEQQKFVCPCHGSTFDRAGSVLSSPAIRPLDFYQVRIENGHIRIDVSKAHRRESFDPSQTTRV